MSTVAKILVVVNLVLAAAFVGSVSTYLGNQDHVKAQMTQLEASLRAEISEKDKLINDKDTQITERNRAIQDKDAALNAANAQVQKLQAEAATAKANYDIKSAALTAAATTSETLSATVKSYGDLIIQLKQQNGTLTAALAAMRDARDAAVETVNRVSNDLDNERQNAQQLKTRVSALTDEKAALELQVEGMGAGGAGVPGVPQPAHTGRILSADNGNNVYVLSLGQEDGVKIGYKYTVSRGSQFVAEIEITDVQAKQSAGRAIRNMKAGDIQLGDVAAGR